VKASHSTPTRWTLIVTAQGSGAAARAALGELIRHYEGFIVWLIRQHGHPSDLSADDLKQEFLAGVLRRNDIAKLAPHLGSFRSWLRTAVRYFLCNERNKWKAIRAGRRMTDPTLFDAFQSWTAEDDLCARAFAEQVILNAIRMQRDEARDKERFDRLVRFLPGPQLDLEELGPCARSYGMSRTALAKSICVMRACFRDHVRAAIRDTLDLCTGPDGPSSPATEQAIDAEMRALCLAYENRERVGIVLESR
jgi:DNA-directed RNA polymerase specialized sigma24 family protein